MIEFATIFLSLTVGPQRVEVVPSPEVAAVDILLDGRAVERVEGPPWQAEVDFGPPMPHRLEAVALDADGNPLAHARQMVNLPRSRAEARLVLAKVGNSYRSARLIWQTAERLELTGLRVTFDGRHLPASDPERILLPEHDPKTLHYLVAELTFEGGTSVEVATAFGAPYGEETVSELTAVALSVAGDGDLDPTEVARWLEVASGPARVVAVESPRAEVVVLRDRASVRHLSRVFRAGLQPGQPTGPRPAWDMGFLTPATRRGASTRGAEGALAPGDELHVLSSVPSRAPSGRLRLFPSAKVPTEVTLVRALCGWMFDSEADGEEDFWAAVRIAGLRAAQGTRRVVVAALHPGDDETPPPGLAETRDYLRTLHVPLQLWTPVAAKRLPPAWADAGLVHVHTPPRLSGAIRHLRPVLDGQRIVWLEGLHLPQEIELTSAAPEWVRFAGSE